VIDVRSLVPLDTRTLLAESARTGRVFTVEENPRLCGWGAEIASVIQEEIFGALKGPIVRITTPHIPLPAADQLEDAVVPSVARSSRKSGEAWIRAARRELDGEGRNGRDHASTGRDGH